MQELEILKDKYEETGYEVYVKSYYGLCISKVENFIKEIYIKYCEEMKLIYYFRKKKKEKKYMEMFSKRYWKKINEITLDPKCKEHMELINLWFDDSVFEELFSSKKYKDIIIGRYEILPQNIDKIYEIIEEITGDKLKCKYKINIPNNISAIQVTNTDIINVKNTFNDIYKHRKKAMHSDSIEVKDMVKLEKHHNIIKLFFNDLEKIKREWFEKLKM